MGFFCSISVVSKPGQCARLQKDGKFASHPFCGQLGTGIGWSLCAEDIVLLLDSFFENSYRVSLVSHCPNGPALGCLSGMRLGDMLLWGMGI